MNFLLKHRSLWTFLILLIISLWPLVWANRGIDLTDTGFYLANYKYAFENDELNSLLFVFTNWVGGLFFTFFSSGQMLLLKITCVLTYAAINFLIYFLLRKYFPLWLILFALACATIYPFHFIYVAGYNTWPYLIYSIAILLLHNGLERDRLGLLMTSAVLIGLNPFFRFPNILHFTVVAVVFWYYGFCLGQWEKALRRTLTFIAVMLATWLACLVICMLTLGPDQVFESLKVIGLMLSGDVSQHGATNFLSKYQNSIREGILLCFIYILNFLLVSLVLLYLLIRYESRAFLAWGALAVNLIVTGSCFWFYQYKYRLHYDYFFHFYSALGPFVCFCGLLYYRKRRPILSALSVIGIITSVALSFGSDFSIMHSVYFFHLVSALTLGLAYLIWNDMAADFSRDRNLKLNRQDGDGKCALVSLNLRSNLMLLFIIALGAHQLTNAELYITFLDVRPKDAIVKVEGVDVLVGMKTSPQKALMLKTVYEKTRPFKDMNLVVLGHFPLSITVTGMTPLFKNSWSDLPSYLISEFEAALANSEKEKNLPLILLAEEFEDGWRPYWKHRKKWKALEEFMTRNNYQEYYREKYFSIHIPGDLAGDEGRGGETLSGAQSSN